MAFVSVDTRVAVTASVDAFVRMAFVSVDTRVAVTASVDAFVFTGARSGR